MSDCEEAGKLAIECLRQLTTFCCGKIIAQARIECGAILEERHGAEPYDPIPMSQSLVRCLKIMSRSSNRLWDLAESDVGREFDVAALQLPCDERFVPSAFNKAAWMMRGFFYPVNMAIALATEGDLVADSCYPSAELLERLEKCVGVCPETAAALVIRLDEQLSGAETQVDDDEVLVARIRQEVAAQRRGISPHDPESDLPESVRPLAPNDRFLLITMLELNATAIKPESGATIVMAALYRGDHKRAFKALINSKLVDSKDGRGGGYWLTKAGEEAARQLLRISKENGATVSPTDCTV